jgi:ferrous iron transport protein B
MPGARLRAPSPPLTLRARPLRVALVGNPNVGKSVIFGRFTGRYVTVANYPGTTVGITRGRAIIGADVCEIIDTPGVNALEGTLSEDEHVSHRILEDGGIDVVVQVADARNLRRALMLTWQIAAFHRPMVLVLNMVDEARLRGIDVDAVRLSTELEIPVIVTVAIDGEGLAELGQSLGRAAVPRVPFGTGLGRNGWAHGLAERLRSVRPGGAARTRDWISRAVREPLTGLPILALVLYGLYLGVGVFGARVLVGLVEHGLFQSYVNPTVVAAANRLVASAWLRDFLVGEYGLFTMGLTYAIAIVLPVVTVFFLMFGWLEDSGYIPRLAIFTDRLFRTMGLNGRAVLPMVLGFGCDTMATMTTRILSTRKERLIAVLLLALGIPCSAQLATILGILGGISLAAVATLLGVVTAEMVLVGFLASRLLPGDRSDFILELPPLRLPSVRHLLVKTAARVRWYLSEAVPLFLAGTTLLFIMDRTGMLAALMRVTRPVVTGWLGLPAEAAPVFVMGFLRRDYGAAGLFQLAHRGGLNGTQAVVALTVMTLFIPCIANLLMIIKEQGVRAAATILVSVTVIAVSTGALLHYGFELFGITF